MPRRFTTSYLLLASPWMFVVTADLAKPVYHLVLGQNEESQSVYLDILGYGSCLFFFVHYLLLLVEKRFNPITKYLPWVYLIGAIGVTARIIQNDLIPPLPVADRVSFSFAAICFIYVSAIALMSLYGFFDSWRKNQRRS